MSRSCAVLLSLLLALGLAGCGAKRPVLYPNAHYEATGEDAADAAVEECLARADAADLEKSKAADAAKKTAGGAAVGGATGAVMGAISGSAGTGAAAGAAGGAVIGLFASLFSSSERDPVYMNYVNRCLAELGYESIGWK